ncbi:MAG TPA: helicase-related protein, partial [Candidatus Hydrogenedentes bacterium]|nr:helicase-related protein [Candidatus Hydrogenedentota bacterium]
MMATSQNQIREGCIVTGSLFNEPMRVETVSASGDGTWIVGLVGMQTERFRRVSLSARDLEELTILDTRFTYDGESRLLRLGLQAYSLGIAWEFDPYFGLSISRVDPLPHQLEAVYDYLLKLARVRFLLADDAGAGKTIMAGLLIRELQLRGLAERILVVCPANLSFQWQRELKEKFDEKFLVLKGGDIRDQFGVNQWLEQKKVITSLDLAKRTEILPGLRQVQWDLIIVDEAHRMSWSPPARKTARYALGELLRDTADHILLLTATPHKGDPTNFTLFLQLLDSDAYADVRSIHEAMERHRAPFYLRRTKEAMVYFPERRPDGTWAAEKIFTKRIPHTVEFQIDGAEFDLYREITRFVKRQSAKAAAQGDDPRARAVGFLMSLYQRRLASSTYAMRHSLENRARRLEEGLKKAQALARQAPPDLPDPEEIEEMEETERDRLEEMLEAITLAGNADQVREEIAELRRLAEQAQAVESSNAEAKLSKLRDLLHQEGFFDHPDQRLLLFTEFKDTLDYLLERLKAWGFKAGCIHGGMKPGSRDEPGTRLYSEQQFREGAIQVLVATEAAGEGINLQVCNILFNYDIPWNPNRLEQRMGRIHRYGQRKDCLIFNFVAVNTIEGKVLQRLLEKLQEIRNALDDDAVFNVVGEILPAAHVERVLRDYYSGKLGDADLEERMLENVEEERFRSICQNALEGLASKKLNLEMLIERRARAQECRVVPETIARFIREAAEYVPLKLKV